MNKTSTQPPLAPWSKGAPHTLNHAAPSPLFPQTSPGDTALFQFGLPKSPKVRFLISHSFIEPQALHNYLNHLNHVTDSLNQDPIDSIIYFLNFCSTTLIFLALYLIFFGNKLNFFRTKLNFFGTKLKFCYTNLNFVGTKLKFFSNLASPSATREATRIYHVYYIITFVVKVKLGQTSKGLKIIWLYVFINSSNC